MNTMNLLMNGSQQLKAVGQVNTFISTNNLKGSRSKDVLIQFEDFQNPHAYNLLNRCKSLCAYEEKQY
jgi:hypothetical protein